LPEHVILQYPFDCPGQYQIRVQGTLKKCWIDHLEGLEISTGPWGNYHLVTQINGWLSDQTALGGLLDLLNDLGMVILTVERLELDEEIE
jgi:hypothetical protein